MLVAYKSDMHTFKTLVTTVVCGSSATNGRTDGQTDRRRAVAVVERDAVSDANAV